jgi:hypothetical protein
LFKNLLKNYAHRGVFFSHLAQPRLEGLAQAFILGRDFSGNDTVSLIRREVYRIGKRVRAEDLNADGLVTRQVAYENGEIIRREYFNRNGRVSLERFGADGYKTDEYRYVNANGKEYEKHHWIFDQGWPVRYAYKKHKRVFEKGRNDWTSIQ